MSKTNTAASKQKANPSSFHGKKGLTDMLLASVLFSLMNACVYAVRFYDNEMPASMVSFVRVLSNLLLLILPALYCRNLVSLYGDRRPSLWLRGLFGSTALMLSFAAISRIGPGESAFLTATSGVFVVLLGPWVLGQKNTWLVWLAILGSFAGAALLFKPDGHGMDLMGRAMALISGFLSALAYLMVARAGRSNAPRSVIFYFCVVAVLLHVLYFAKFGFQLPYKPKIWGLLLLIGVLGSGAQFCMTRAYQAAPAALVSAVAYLAPVLSLVWGFAFFAQWPGQNALVGSLLILIFGVVLPFIRKL
ncbi:DMT family transporter [Methylomonas sp. SURF-2]|uniref:DMT family transporter n=1 Tax=Methylomonas subterranea TaxID=2952225 RepID=A0ABT1TI70_9GAMM|nr:DMT family transporter [Methylomonas sp. SURF-2]MCQ8104464.1 DMT family transporter [Methylomonas sp. SURF-2]